jgi:hypothetical protein
VPDSLKGLSSAPKRIGVTDRGGFGLKEYLAGMLRQARYEVVDFGDSQPKPDDDYRDLVVPLARAVACGEERSSRSGWQAQLMQRVFPAGAGRFDAIIYTVGLFDEAEEDRNPGVLTKIARATGGEAFMALVTSKVVPICEQIAEDIRNQYTIGYFPSNHKLDNAQRTIKVAAAGRHGEKLRVRTRVGYIASPERTGKPVSSQRKLP